MALDRKWRALALLATAELFAMALWFSATAVAPDLAAEWGLSAVERAWLTNAVQVGFVVGALTLGSALPHLLRAVGGVGRPRAVLLGAALLAVVGGALALRVEQGPYPGPDRAVRPAGGPSAARQPTRRAGELRLLRAHVGAVRRLDADTGVPRGERGRRERGARSSSSGGPPSSPTPRSSRRRSPNWPNPSTSARR